MKTFLFILCLGLLGPLSAATLEDVVGTYEVEYTDVETMRLTVTKDGGVSLHFEGEEDEMQMSVQCDGTGANLSKGILVVEEISCLGKMTMVDGDEEMTIERKYQQSFYADLSNVSNFDEFTAPTVTTDDPVEGSELAEELGYADDASFKRVSSTVAVILKDLVGTYEITPVENAANTVSRLTITADGGVSYFFKFSPPPVGSESSVAVMKCEGTDAYVQDDILKMEGLTCASSLTYKDGEEVEQEEEVEEDVPMAINLQGVSNFDQFTTTMLLGWFGDAEAEAHFKRVTEEE